MKPKKRKYPTWTLINWECWRKSFGRGHVSVGVGKFDLIVYSHGANSDESLSSTRWRLNGYHLTEQQAMELVDREQGYYDPRQHR